MLPNDNVRHGPLAVLPPTSSQGDSAREFASDSRRGPSDRPALLRLAQRRSIPRRSGLLEPGDWLGEPQASIQPAGSAPNLRVVIVDDELLARRRLRRYLAEETGISSIVECACGRDAVAEINGDRSAAVFVDADLPDLWALGNARDRAQAHPGLVLLLGEGRHTFRTNSAHHPDYLLKPVARDPLRAVLDRVRQRVPSDVSRAGRLEGHSRRTGIENRVIIRCAGRILAVPTESIERIEAADNYVRVHAGGRVHTVRETLDALEARLDPARFFRPHRSAIVNIGAVEEIRTLRGAWHICLHSGVQVPVGRTRRKQLRGILGT